MELQMGHSCWATYIRPEATWAKSMSTNARPKHDFGGKVRVEDILNPTIYREKSRLLPVLLLVKTG